MKPLLRKIKKLVISVFGTKGDLLLWRFRHTIDPDWPKAYISESSLNHPHREILIKSISKYAPKNILEIGCASGPNLILLAEKMPETKMLGLDISGRAIATGREYIEHRKIKNIKLETGNVLNLKNIPDNSFDLVFTDATLIYVDKKRIKKVIKELVRISKEIVILNEWHTNAKDSLYQGHWIHNYKDLFGKIVPDAEIKLKKIPAKIWSGDWANYGYLVEITQKPR